MLLGKYWKISFGLLLATAMVFAVDFSLNRSGFWEPNLRAVGEGIEKNLAASETAYYSLVNDAEKLNDLVRNKFASKEYSKLKSLPFSLVLYNDSSVIFWDENAVIPQRFLAGALNNGASFLRLSNGYYQILKSTHVVDGQTIEALGLRRVKSNYRIENKYLVNTFDPSLNVPPYLNMSLTRELDAVPVHDKQNRVLFFLTINQFEFNKLPKKGRDVIYWTILALVFLSINFFAFGFINKGKPWLGVFVLAGVLLGIRFFMINWDYPAVFTRLDVFNPQFYASSSINKSLADLLLNVLALFNVVYFIFMFAPWRAVTDKKGIIIRFIPLLGYSLLYASAYAIGTLYNSLLLNSNIPFNLNNFMDLNWFSLLGLICLSFVLLGFYMMSFRITHYLKEQQLSARYHNLVILVLGIVIATGLWFFKHEELPVFTVIWSTIFLLYVCRQVRNEREMLNFANLIVLVILFALLSSVHMYTYNQVRETEKLKSNAHKIADQRDRVVEYLFLDVENRIFADNYIKYYFLTPFISTSEVMKRIKTLYLGGYFTKYDVDVYLLNKQGQLILSEKDNFLDLLDENAELSPPSDYLYFIPKAGGTYAYLCNLPILYKNKFLGTVIFQLTPKVYDRSHLYPELLLEDNVQQLEQENAFSYAVYIDSFMIYKEGSYAYNYQYNFPDSSDAEYSEVRGNNDGLIHFIYRPEKNKRVVITTRADTLLEPVTLFSYLFGVFLIFSLLVALIRFVFKVLTGQLSFGEILNLTFKDRIQYSMIAIMIFSFLVIGYSTILHFRSEYNNYHLVRLISQERAIRSAIEYIVRGKEELLETPYTPTDDEEDQQQGLDLPSLSAIHLLDVNIYNLAGELVNTSQPDIFEKGLISQRMNADAYDELRIRKKSQYIQNETIGQLDYLSVYVPLRDTHGKILAYLNLPYFAKEKELQGEISSFLVALINVYVFLLVVGGFLAYLLSNSITASLSAISNKLKFTQLGRKNEPIEWNADDEIGRLVKEYNKMIIELENSARLLARSERESAWREMARQVAHEIKNPLTPMKLSIQHLQRAIAEKRPNVDELANKVISTLIEQIENLNHIASEFSTFAKMPTAKNEVFDLVEVIESVAHLFGENRQVTVRFTRPADPVWVYADKNQVLRVLNNLVKNAVQAIPDNKRGTVEISVRLKLNSCIITVADNGAGIPKSQQEKVFQPNFTTKTSGTGLGLSISRQIVENTGGEIWFESKEGKGTSFFVKLPLHKRMEQA